MKKLLVDTSVIIDFLRVKDKSKTLLYKIAEEDLHVSIITHTELFAGKSIWGKPDAQAVVRKILEGMSMVPLEEHISEKAGHVKAHSNTSLIDAIIAASALSLGAEVVTFNFKDFKDISGLKIFDSAAN